MFWPIDQLLLQKQNFCSSSWSILYPFLLDNTVSSISLGQYCSSSLDNTVSSKNTVSISLAMWLTIDQLSCNFENIGGGVTPPCPPQCIPASGQLHLQVSSL